jgi:hypothetical protein
MRAAAGLIVSALVAVGFVSLPSLPRQALAVGVCDCCANELSQSCETACRSGSKAPGQCTAIPDYIGKGASAGAKNNPLTGISLRDLSLGNPTAAQLESFRRFLEAGRRRAVADYSRAASRLKHGRISQEEFDAAKALHREAMVNYYHGMRAYLVKIGAKPD